MRQGFTSDEVIDLYHDVAPRAFAVFGKDPVEFSIPADHYTAPENACTLGIMLGTDIVAHAETYYYPLGQRPSAPLAADTPALGITFNPWILPIVYEDEVWTILLHEIAHAAGVWEDSHFWQWKARAAVFGDACSQQFLDMRAIQDHPYRHLMDDEAVAGSIPTLDRFSVYQF